MDKFNKDSYREPISDNDLGKESLDFSGLSETKEEVLPLDEVKEEKPIAPSIKDSIIKEEEVVPPEDFVQTSSIKDSTMVVEAPKDVSVFPHIEIKEQEEPVVEEKESQPIREEVKPLNIEIKEQEEEPIVKASPVIEEENPLKRKIEINEQEEPVVEEAPVEIEESYKEIRDDFWEKINPSNVNRFKDLGLEETEENRSLLNDLSVKVTFLDDDLEDGVISEKEAVSKIKEIQSKL